MRRLLPFLFAPLVLLAVCAKGEEDAPPPPTPIPELTKAQTTMLAETQDFVRNFDEAGLYALLDAAHGTPRDAFGGAKPLEVVDVVDPNTKRKVHELAVMKDPSAHRGEAVLIEGRFIASQDGVPNNPGGLLARQDPRWGCALACWVVRIGRTERDPQAMVYFPMNGPPLPTPRIGQTVRVAARFYKIFTAETMVRDPKNHGQLVPAGREDPYAAFVGVGAQVVPARLFGGELSPTVKIALVIVLIAAGFGALWFIKTFTRSMGGGRGLKSPAQRWEERREREREEGVEDDDDMELPEDPAEALKKLGGGKE